MSEEGKIRLIKYGLAVIFVGAVTFFHVWLVGNFGEMTWHERFHVLCDGFTISGLLELMLGCLFALTSGGALDGVGYVLSVGLGKLIPGRGLQKDEKYYDYVQRKKEKRITGYGFLIITGAATMLIAILLLILYYKV